MKPLDLATLALALSAAVAAPETGASMIEHRCPGCGAMLRIPSRYAGTRGACKHCGAAILVPPVAPGAPPSIGPPAGPATPAVGPTAPPPGSAPPRAYPGTPAARTKGMPRWLLVAGVVGVVVTVGVAGVLVAKLVRAKAAPPAVVEGTALSEVGAETLPNAPSSLVVEAKGLYVDVDENGAIRTYVVGKSARDVEGETWVAAVNPDIARETVRWTEGAQVLVSIDVTDRSFEEALRLPKTYIEAATNIKGGLLAHSQVIAARLRDARLSGTIWWDLAPEPISVSGGRASRREIKRYWSRSFGAILEDTSAVVYEGATVRSG